MVDLISALLPICTAMQNNFLPTPRRWTDVVDEHCEQFEAMFDLVLDVIERALGARRVIAPAKSVRRSLGPDHRVALAFAEQLITMMTAGRPMPDRTTATSVVGIVGREELWRCMALQEAIDLGAPFVPESRSLSPWTSIVGYDEHAQVLPILVASRKDRMEALLRRGIAAMRGGMLAQRVTAPVARLREAVDAGPDYPTALRAIRLLQIIMTAGRALPKPPEQRVSQERSDEELMEMLPKLMARWDKRKEWERIHGDNASQVDSRAARDRELRRRYGPGAHRAKNDEENGTKLYEYRTQS